MSTSSSVLHRLFHAWTAMLLLVSFFIMPGSQAGADNLALTPEEQAASLLERLTPEERVGQLFLVSFNGNEVGPESRIYELITSHHVGGVVLLARNDNIVDADPSAPDPTRPVFSLIQQLQESEWEYSRQSVTQTLTGESYVPSYIPLFAGLSQEGDGYPYDQILHGVTQLPNAMSLGATWTPDLAVQVGDIQGKELSLLGFNLLLGPVLDVLEAPLLDVTNNLGTRTFGGDPYWVGEMGRAYLRGVHQGSQGKVAVVAKHFPGHGSSDRLPEEEVATVRKTLEELISFDLAPFIAVTGNATTAEDTADALLVSHIRYQGLQGNIRATTRPVSLDPQALSLLIGLPELSSWRNNGGLMVSDDLGSQAVRRFYDLTSQTFDARRVALNAFLAGNDLLYIADFSSPDEVDSDLAALRTLDFFTQKYREDSAFAQRVNDSVQRILTLKFRLYPNFSLGNVLPEEDNLGQLNQAGPVTFDVARKAATLISPTQADLDETMPDPPNQNDRIVFISDTRSGQQCSECPPFPLLEETAVQDAVIRLYGPQAGGQVTANLLNSYSLEELEEMLDVPPNTAPLERSLRRANWIVFAMLSDQKNTPSFQTLRRFLNERPDLFQQKRLIVFALCAPYYLDATNISKLTAYYGLYGKTPQTPDIIAYLLFGELRATGASPVSIAGTSYNLNEALFPDPDRPIPLELDLPAEAPTPEATTTVEPTPPPEFRVGDIIPLRAGVILDHNGNPVPDGTPVSFIFTISGEATSIRQDQVTHGGIARTTYTVTAPGSLDIYAESENARSALLQIDIPSPTGEVATLTPTPEPTQTHSPTPTVITPQPVQTPEPPAPASGPGLTDWLFAILISGAVAWGSYRLAALAGQVRWGVRAGFLALIGGLLAYSYLALQMPGTQAMLESSVARSVFLFTLGGTMLGLLVVLTWRAISEAEHRRSMPEEGR
jgi:beta-N-acetylhexosaminidase